LFQLIGCTELPVITDNKGKQQEEEEQENLKVPAKFSLWSCETWNHKYTARLAVGATIAATILFVVVAITLPIAIAKHRENTKLKAGSESAEKRIESEINFSNFLSEKAIKTDKEKEDETESVAGEINAEIDKRNRSGILKKTQININKNEEKGKDAVFDEVNIDKDLVKATLGKLSKDEVSLPALVKSLRAQIEQNKEELNESEPIYLQVAKIYINSCDRIVISAILGNLERTASVQELSRELDTTSSTLEQKVWNETIIIIRRYIFCKEIKDYFEKL
jgi:hypothetical protein